MAKIFDQDSRFVFHDACFTQTDMLTQDEKRMADDYDADKEAEKLAEDYEAPEICDHCGAFLVSDQRAPESKLAQQLRNLAIGYRDAQVTILLDNLAKVAQLHDGNTADLYRHSARMLRDNAPVIQQTAWCGVPPIAHAAWQAIGLISTWAQEWDARYILKLHKITDEEYARYDDLDGYTYADEEHSGWDVYDMSGYLDMYNDGESVCSCGTRITSVCAYDASNLVEFGPCCFTIE